MITRNILQINKLKITEFVFFIWVMIGFHHRSRMAEMSFVLQAITTLIHSLKKANSSNGKALNPLTPGIVFWKPTPRVSASLGRTGHLPNRSFSVCGLANSGRFALHSEKAHCSVACGSIHASTFPLPGLQMGPIVKLVIFMQIWPFHFLTTHKGQSPYIQEPG